MAFEKFKREVRNMSKEQIEKEIKDRRMTLFKWNFPNDRIPTSKGARGRVPIIASNHPYKQIRKELAILLTIKREKNNHGHNN